MLEKMVRILLSLSPRDEADDRVQGWSKGSGLGATGEGIVAPILASQFAQGAGLGSTKGPFPSSSFSSLSIGTDEAVDRDGGRYVRRLEQGVCRAGQGQGEEETRGGKVVVRVDVPRSQSSPCSSFMLPRCTLRVVHSRASE